MWLCAYDEHNYDKKIIIKDVIIFIFSNVVAWFFIVTVHNLNEGYATFK